MTKNNNKLKSFIGFFDIKILDITIILAVIEDHNDFIKLLNKKENKEISDFIDKKLGTFEMGDGSGVLYKNTNLMPVAIYIHNDCYEDERLNEILIHETNHLVRRLSEWACFEKEIEFSAYLQTNLFRDIKKIIKIKSYGKTK